MLNKILAGGFILILLVIIISLLVPGYREKQKDITNYKKAKDEYTEAVDDLAAAKKAVAEAKTDEERGDFAVKLAAAMIEEESAKQRMEAAKAKLGKGYSESFNIPVGRSSAWGWNTGPGYGAGYGTGYAMWGIWPSTIRSRPWRRWMWGRRPMYFEGQQTAAPQIDYFNYYGRPRFSYPPYFY